MSYYLVNTSGRIVGEVDDQILGLASFLHFKKGEPVAINFVGGPLHTETKVLCLGRKFSHDNYQYEVVLINGRWFAVERTLLVEDYAILAKKFDQDLREKEQKAAAARVADELLKGLGEYTEDFLSIGWDRAVIHFDGKNWKIEKGESL